MAYVDLDPIRVRMAESPEESDHTSIKQRIEQVLKAEQSYQPDQQSDTLFPFAGNPKKDMPDGIPFKRLVGAAHHVRNACEDMGKCWVHGISQCEKLFSSS